MQANHVLFFSFYVKSELKNIKGKIWNVEESKVKSRKISILMLLCMLDIVNYLIIRRYTHGVTVYFDECEHCKAKHKSNPLLEATRTKLQIRK